MKELPIIACSLDADGLRVRLQEFTALFLRALEPAVPIEGGRAWRFAPELEPQVRALAVRELECCPFWDIRVTPDAETVVLEIRGPAEAAPLLERFA